MQRTAPAIWRGDLKSGREMVFTESGVLAQTQYLFATRLKRVRKTCVSATAGMPSPASFVFWEKVWQEELHGRMEAPPARSIEKFDNGGQWLL